MVLPYMGRSLLDWGRSDLLGEFSNNFTNKFKRIHTCHNLTNSIEIYKEIGMMF